jgi:hypothetical protein
MPPYSSPAPAPTHDDNDFGRPHARVVAVSTGFTSTLLESIANSKSQMELWAQHEMAKADAVAESYRQCLIQEQAEIDARLTELLTIQMERGMKIDVDTVDKHENSDNNNNLVSRKQALEEQTTALQIEVMKLTTERDNRERRIRGMTKRV